MAYTVAVDTDVGPVKQINQDSILVKHARKDTCEMAMAIVCDGMGGFSKGELASATVVRAFSQWFDFCLPKESEQKDLGDFASDWVDMLKVLNEKILAYSQESGVQMGTTFSGIFFAGGQYIAVHVGDSRIYKIDNQLLQITQDQTFVAREVERGTMTLEQALQDNRRNMLLQCIGASKTIEPAVYEGTADDAVFVLCSDGLPHHLTPAELQERLNPFVLGDKAHMQNTLRELIELAKTRNERDNISAIAIKTS